MAKTDKLKKAVEEAYELDEEITSLEQQIERFKDQRKKLLTETIPDLMSEVGTNVFGVPGTEVECRVVPYYHANIKFEQMMRAVKWMDANGHGDLPKRTITVDFNREDQDAARRIFQRIQQMLAEEDIIERTQLNMKYGVHWKTLTAFVKEQIEQGAALPLELLGATVGQVATFKARS
jgi:hypothetical protein